MDIVYLGTSRIHRNRANLVQTLHTVAAIHRLKVNIKLYLPPKKSGLDVKKRLEDFGIKENLPVYFSSFLHSRWKRLNYFPFILIYKKMLKRTKHVYIRSPQLSLALIKYRIPHHLEIHDVDTLKKEKWLYPIVHAHRNRLINWLFPISLSAANQLVNYGADKKRIKVLPSGVDLSLFNTIKPVNFDELKKVPKIFYIGRISKSRGLKIFEKVARLNLGEVNLVGEAEDTISCDSNLKYHGPVVHRRVPKYYEQSHIILLPYQTNLEHINSISPIKLFEAMASGRAIIVSNIPPVREIVTHEKEALLVDPEDENGWIEAIERLKNDIELTKKICENAKIKVQKYSWEERAKKIIRTLNLKVDPNGYKTSSGAS